MDNTENNFQSFYTVVPSAILFDENLTDAEFRLLCILLSFLTIKGEAYPSNKYLSDKFNKSVWNVSKYITKLSDKGFIDIEFELDGKEIKKRIIKPTDLLLKLTRGIVKNDKGGIVKIDKDNNISNTNSISLIESIGRFETFWKIYDKKTGKDNSLKQWNKLTEAEKEKCLSVVKQYVISKPDKQFRKDPERYLRHKVFNDEIITGVKKSKTVNGDMVIDKGLPQYTAAEWDAMINVTCKTANERSELFNKYQFDNLTKLWLRKGNI